MAISYPAPSRLLALADWEALPEDELHHVELVDPEGATTVLSLRGDRYAEVDGLELDGVRIDLD